MYTSIFQRFPMLMLQLINELKLIFIFETEKTLEFLEFGIIGWYTENFVLLIKAERNSHLLFL